MSTSDLTGWTRVGCLQSNELRWGIHPADSSREESLVFTEWANSESGAPVLRDYLWYEGERLRRCDHYVPVKAERQRISPDCADGKHHACHGTAWDFVADEEVDCECAHHREASGG